jgi:hypothetical protein
MTAGEKPTAVTYNLGETTIVQSRFPEDSRFHDMPVRLNGIIAAPTGGDGPYPVVLIIHGTHHGCPEQEGGVDRWPCDPEVEQPNYQGFGYLVEALAAEGYVAIAPNFNAENTFGFGEGTPGERLSQLLELHMGALAEAACAVCLVVCPFSQSGYAKIKSRFIGNPSPPQFRIPMESIDVDVSMPHMRNPRLPTQVVPK